MCLYFATFCVLIYKKIYAWMINPKLRLRWGRLALMAYAVTGFYGTGEILFMHGAFGPRVFLVTATAVFGLWVVVYKLDSLVEEPREIDNEYL